MILFPSIPSHCAMGWWATSQTVSIFLFRQTPMKWTSSSSPYPGNWHALHLPRDHDPFSSYANFLAYSQQFHHVLCPQLWWPQAERPFLREARQMWQSQGLAPSLCWPGVLVPQLGSVVPGVTCLTIPFENCCHFLSDGCDH